MDSMDSSVRLMYASNSDVCAQVLAPLFLQCCCFLTPPRLCQCVARGYLHIDIQQGKSPLNLEVELRFVMLRMSFQSLTAAPQQLTLKAGAGACCSTRRAVVRVHDVYMHVSKFQPYFFFFFFSSLSL